MITKNEAHIIISNELKLRRQNAEIIKNERIDDACKRSVDFKNLYNKTRSLQCDYAKFPTKSNAAKQIKLEFNKTRDQLRNELKKLGYKKEDMELQFHCSKCKDLGYVNNTPCSCYTELKNKIYLDNSGVKKSDLPCFSKIDFEIFDKDKQEEIKNIYKVAKNFIDKFYEIDKQNIVILGNTGVGKTYLTDCILNEAIKKDIFTLSQTAFSINNDFYAAKFANIKEREEIFEPYLTCDLLIIDDLGSEPKYDNTTIEGFYNILNERTRAGLKTIITSNYSPEQIQELYQERVFSRIFNKQIGIIINMPDCNLRLKSKRK